MNNLFKIGVLFIVPIIAQMVLGEDFCNDPFDREILKRSEVKPDWPTTAVPDVALGDVERDMETFGEASIELAKGFLGWIAETGRLNYQDEIRYLGDQSILSHVLLLKYNYVDKAGRWRFPFIRRSLLGQVLRKNVTLFPSVKDSDFAFCPDLRDINKWSHCKAGYVIVLGNFETSGEYEFFSKDRKCQVLCLRVEKYGKCSMTINLMESTLNGMGLPVLLGFKTEKQEITYANRKELVDIPVYVESLE